MEISAKGKSSPQEFHAYGESEANNVLHVEQIGLCNLENGCQSPRPTEQRKRDLLFHARVARARVHLRSRIPTVARKFVHRSLPLPLSRARRVADSRKLLRKLRRRASLPRRMAATTTSLKAADEAGSEREPLKTVGPSETIAATIAADCDKMSASSDRAAVVLCSPLARQMESLPLRQRSRALARASRLPWHTR